MSADLLDLAGAFDWDLSTPSVAPFPRNVPKSLLDDGLTHYEASIAGFAERYRRGETPQTIHVWWARRPHSAMRALLFAALSLDRSPIALDLMKRLSCQPLASDKPLIDARASLRRSGKRARVLDMFGGGGTIAFEGSSLGLEMHSTDSNELSVFVQKSLLVHGRNSADTLAERVDCVGKRVLDQLHRATARLYPARDRAVTSYLWSYSVECEKCAMRFLLVKRPWLSRKSNKHISMALRVLGSSQIAEIRSDSEEGTAGLNWTGRNGTVTCPTCTNSQKVNLQGCRDELLVNVTVAKSGKSFSLPALGDIIADETLTEIESSVLSEFKIEPPNSELPVWSGIVNPAVYGMRTHADVFNRRQRIVVLQLLNILRQEFECCLRQYGREQALAILGLLSSLIDQMVDWNCRLSMWISQNEQVGRAFCGPGVAMIWDYTETDPTSKGPGNLRKKLDRIVSGARALTKLEAPCYVNHAYAQRLPFDDEYFDAIVTDPPYYDNIYYNVLADFFYAWKRPLLSIIEPELFRRLSTDSTKELVASAFRSGTAARAHEDYVEQFSAAIAEAARVLKVDGIFALLYSHSSILGWAAIVRSYRASALCITSVQPLSIERKQRPRAMTSEAVNTCVVFVARKSAVKRAQASLEELTERIEPILSSLNSSLSSAGWSAPDIGVAAYAHAVAMLANVAGLKNGVTDIEALQHMGRIVKAMCPEFQVTSRTSL